MEIRTADEHDAADIADIIKRHAQEDYMGYATFDVKYIRDKMKRDYFVVADEGGIIGCVRLSIVDIDLAEIRTMCVDEGHRKKGIATQLMNETMKISKAKKIRKLITRTKADNKIAINFFKKFNFVEEGYFKEHYRKGIDVIQFSLFI